MSDGTGQAPLSSAAEATEQAKGPFFGWRDKLAFLIAAVVAFFGYLLTLQPSVGLEDSGEFLTAGHNLGVPHPPGYPIWTIFAYVWQYLIPFGNVAWRINLMSAFFGAFGIGLVALLISKAGHEMARRVGFLHRIADERAANLVVLASSVSAALMFAFSPVMWSQSVITEVYALNVFFLVTTLVLLYRWSFEPERLGRLYLAAFIWGVSLTNHQTLVLLVVAFPAFVWFIERKLGRDMLSPILIVMVLGALKQVAGIWQTVGAMQQRNFEMGLQGAIQPSPWNIWFFPFVVYLLVAIGGAVWIYFLAKGGGWPMQIAAALVLGAIGLVSIGVSYLGFDFVNGVQWVAQLVWRDASGGPLSKVALRNISVFLVVAGSLLGIAAAAWIVFQWMWDSTLVRVWRKVALVYAMVVLGTSLYGYMPLSSATNPPMNWGYTRTPEGFVHHFTRGQYEKVKTERQLLAFWGQLNMFFEDLQSQFNIVFALLALLALFFYRDLDERNRNWLRFLLIGFLFLNLGFIFLSNPTFEKQKQITDRVFFLPGHCLYALWIGYGLILGLGYLLAEKPQTQKAVSPLAALVALLPAVSVWLNWAANEQGGHDFGYKFGYLMFKPGGGYPEMDRDAVLFGGTDPGRFVPTYMILVESQAPASWKTRMAKYPESGTFDRRDVYIITQNALADNTYMNYVRDHYGFERPDGNVSATLTNRSAWQRALFKFGWNYLGRKDAYPKEPIWVPSSSDSQSAFQQYLDEIRARGAATDENVKVEGGRVSVQGVQHVMAINGILTKWIFDRNKAKHSFYVEESYIIPWMYPHLTPYGIILKINKDPVPSPEENPGFWQEIIQRDRQYWDALVDELKKDNRFRRDDVAQKSFAKLRAAIGGVYAFRRLYAEAEYAYRQSISLCPDTPEGNFRLAQMYVEMGNASDDISRFDMGLEVMTVYGKRDPYNAKIREAIAALRDIRTLAVSQGELEQQRAKQPDDLSTATRLVFVYARRMRTREMDQLVDSLMQRPDFAADQFRQVTQLYIQMSRIDRAADVLKVFTRRYPDNPSGWLDLAIAQIGLNRCDEAAVAVERALALDKSGQLRNFVMQDRRFQPCRNNPRFRVLLGQQPGRLLPGGVIVTP